MNYSIEGNIDFYKELLNTLCETTTENTDLDSNDILENENKTENSNEKCLISHDKLYDPYITLNCSHKFNYIPLFNEVRNQKHKNNYQNRHLRVNQFKCPYCRQIQNKLLPYSSNIDGVSLITGVTKPIKYSMFDKKCQTIIKSGKRKGQPCGKSCIFPNLTCKCHTNKTVKETNNIKINTCQAIIKSGKRKGQPCGCKIYQNNMCKRHYNLANKIT